MSTNNQPEEEAESNTSDELAMHSGQQSVPESVAAAPTATGDLSAMADHLGHVETPAEREAKIGEDASFTGSPTGPAWCVVDQVAQFTVNGQTWRLSLRRPDRGLVPDDDDRRSILAVSVPQAVGDAEECAIDHYVRGDSLVACYSATHRHPLRVTCHWRRLQHAAGFGFDLEVSAQTHLLDYWAEAHVGSRWPATEVWHLSPDQASASPLARSSDGVLLERRFHLVLLRAAGEASYFECLHPADEARQELQWRREPAQAHLVHQVFRHPLEKGVILRVRLRAGVVPAESDESVAREAWQSFASAPPPLSDVPV